MLSSVVSWTSHYYNLLILQHKRLEQCKIGFEMGPIISVPQEYELVVHHLTSFVIAMETRTKSLEPAKVMINVIEFVGCLYDGPRLTFQDHVTLQNVIKNHSIGTYTRICAQLA